MGHVMDAPAEKSTEINSYMERNVNECTKEWPYMGNMPMSLYGKDIIKYFLKNEYRLAT